MSVIKRLFVCCGYKTLTSKPKKYDKVESKEHFEDKSSSTNQNKNTLKAKLIGKMKAMFNKV